MSAIIMNIKQGAVDDRHRHAGRTHKRHVGTRQQRQNGGRKEVLPEPHEET